MTIEEEKTVHTKELHHALLAISTGVTASISREAMEVGKILLDIRAKLKGMNGTEEVTNLLVRNLERSLDSLMVAEIEQVDAKKRKRAIGEILSRINRCMIELGFPDLMLQEAVHIEVPAEAPKRCC